MRVQTRHQHHITLLSAVETIILNPDQDLDLKDLGFSKDHFNRFFGDAMGESYSQFRRRIRLERSAQALRSGNLVWEVAVEAGYATQEAFSKAFRTEYGVSPRAYSRGVQPTRPTDLKKVHWGDSHAPLSIEPAARFGACLISREEIEIAAIEFVGDYVDIPAKWESLALTIPDEVREARTWITVFHSDGMKAAGRDRMKSRLGYITTGEPQLAGFEPYTIAGGSYVTSTQLNGRKQHSEAWAAFNHIWIPKTGPRRPDYQAFDLYSRFPAPFSDVQARIHLRLG